MYRILVICLVSIVFLSYLAPAQELDRNRVLYETALGHFKKKEYTNAENVCQQLLTRTPDYYLACKLLSDIAKQKKDKDGELKYLYNAYEILNQKKALTPEQTEAWKEYDQKLDKLNPIRKKVKERRNEYIGELIALAKQEYEENRIENAIRSLKTVLLVDPRHEESINLLKEYEILVADQSKPQAKYKVFNGRNLLGWETIRGVWEVQNRKITGKEDIENDPPFQLRCQKEALVNFRFSTKLILVSGQRWGSEAILTLHTEDTEYHEFRFHINEKSATLNVVALGGSPDREPEPKTISIQNLPEPLKLDEEYTFTMAKKDNKLTLQIAGKAVLSHDFEGDIKFGSISVSIGLSKGACRFSDLQLKDREADKK
ncbi:tetratricopeptide repeat protein [Planctomycetota bacterium]